MTSETLIKANKIKEELDVIRLRLTRASSGEFRIASYSNGTWSDINIDTETFELVQLIVTDRLEKDLEDKQKEFNDL